MDRATAESRRHFIDELLYEMISEPERTLPVTKALVKIAKTGLANGGPLHPDRASALLTSDQLMW
jgi:hypothetical protein